MLRTPEQIEPDRVKRLQRYGVNPPVADWPEQDIRLFKIPRRRNSKKPQSYRALRYRDALDTEGEQILVVPADTDEAAITLANQVLPVLLKLEVNS